MFSTSPIRLSPPGLWSRSRRLGLETYQRLVSVSSRDCQRLGLVSVSRGRRLGLGHLRLVPKTNFRPNCAWPQYAAWTRFRHCYNLFLQIKLQIFLFSPCTPWLRLCKWVHYGPRKLAAIASVTIAYNANCHLF